MTVLDLVLTPRDGLFCKDGRGWFTSSLGRGHALDWPHPSTIRGALRAAVGRAREQDRGRALAPAQWPEHTEDVELGASLALRRPWSDGDWQARHRLWPAPADARQLAGAVVERLDPRPSTVATLGRDDDPVRETLWTAPASRNKPLPALRWWSETDFVAWLAGDVPPRLDPPPTLERPLLTRVSIDPARQTAADGRLFAHDLVETVEREACWALACRLTARDRPELCRTTLGSDRRLVAIDTLPPAVFAPPPQLRLAFEAGATGLRLVLVTPAAFSGGWLPDGFTAQDGAYRGRLPGSDAELVLRAAMVPRPLAISGWDMAKRKPKVTTRAAPPGAVYFFVRCDGRPFTADQAEALWLAALGSRQHEGFGRVVPGIWTPNAPAH